MQTVKKQTDTVSRRNVVDEAVAIRKMSFVSVQATPCCLDLNYLPVSQATSVPCWAFP